MWGSRICTALGIIIGCASCGATGMLVKPPVTNACSSTKLQKCDELADAVLAYVEGDKASAESMLRTVASANSPEDIRAFARTLRPLVASLGGETGASIGAVLAILEGSADPMTPDPGPHPHPTSEPKAAVPSVAALGEPGGSRSTAGSRTDLVRTGMARPSVDPRAVACDLGPFAVEQPCKKVRAVIGPLTVTNLYASGGCPDELFAYAGRADDPHWFVSNLPNATLNVTGQFALDDGEELFIGARAKDISPATDMRCAVVWSGLRPDGAE